MSNFLLGLLQFRRGTTAERLTVVFEEAEPVFDLTLKEFFIGDGVTLGGVPLNTPPKVVNQAVNLIATADNHNNFTRFTSPNLTYTFSGSTYVVGKEYHGRNASTGELTLVEASGFVIHLPTEGSLIIPPGGTFTLKIVASNEADLFGISEAP